MLQQQSYSKPVMPLLMGFTPQTPIEAWEINARSVYDDVLQIVEYDMAVGTKCLRSSASQKKMPSGAKYTTTDKKNEIDDSK